MVTGPDRDAFGVEDRRDVSSGTISQMFSPVPTAPLGLAPLCPFSRVFSARLSVRLSWSPEPIWGTYADYRLFSRDGKGSARYFDHLDVDGDGTDEIVLEVMGEDSMWLSTLGRQGASWVEEYRDPCGLPPGSSQPAR